MRMLAHDDLRDAVLLIYAKQTDLPHAMTVAEITEKLNLHSIKNRHIHIQPSSATVDLKWDKEADCVSPMKSEGGDQDEKTSKRKDEEDDDDDDDDDGSDYKCSKDVSLRMRL
ncbi:hypothetical protein Pmani_037333 [Petrolisthes manimaculis]|uniref:Uncharacterized protein n=1 Tax=Petrolisthes manimaculis TaxID=1843537 RepID=A0AAE1NGF9_9EUCA|nr:hypothetical protein Pmani_037333 [Petrolisthes manimaculis]